MEIPAPTIRTMFLKPPFFQCFITPSKSTVSRICLELFLDVLMSITSNNDRFFAKYSRIASTDKSGFAVDKEDEGSSDFLESLDTSDSFSVDLLESSPKKQKI